MQLALEQARAAELIGEVPVGAVVVDASGELVGVGHNRVITDSDPTAHAEIVAMRRVGALLENYRMPGLRVYVTLEPCAMCAMAMIHARIEEVTYATADPKTGACGSVFDLVDDPRHNHRVRLRSGLLAAEASQMLSGFFRARRTRV
ncbi:MAG: tRNA adenosine(34) deaminase TadA [Xanthomonadales bacterium]|nr:tRNA adenosine(34) deaminase TadA [Xanthomonadales bacterium]